MSNLKLSYLHLDSKGLAKSLDSSKITYNIIPGNRSFAPNAFNIMFPLRQPLFKCRRIALKSFEVPIIWNTVRAIGKSNYVTFIADTVTYTITIPDNSYTDIAVLISDLNVAITQQFSSSDLVFSLSTTTNYGNVKLSSNTLTSIVNVQTELGYMLGFRPAESIDAVGVKYCIAGSSYNLNLDNYIVLNFPNLSGVSSTNASGKVGHFKIPLAGGSNSVSFQSDLLSFAQSVDTSPDIPISYIELTVTDRNGYSLNSMGADLSMSLAIWTDE